LHPQPVYLPNTQQWRHLPWYMHISGLQHGQVTVSLVSCPLTPGLTTPSVKTAQ
jgi:N-acetylneuraminic acid mutarotase